MNKQQLQTYLRRLGLNSEEAKIYLELLEQAETTPLLLSRKTGINRTKVYRVIEDLAREKLIQVEVGMKTTKISPAPIGRLEERLRERQKRVAELARDWQEVARELTQLTEVPKAETKVRYYRGKQGIEQMVWNALSAQGEIVGYTTRDLSDFVGERFMKDFVTEFRTRNIKMRDIYGDEYQESKHIQYDWGEKIDSRYVPKNILTIKHQMDIYDETVSFYRWVGEEVFGVEIVNKEVAEMQKQLFELAWEKGKNISA